MALKNFLEKFSGSKQDLLIQPDDKLISEHSVRVFLEKWWDTRIIKNLSSDLLENGLKFTHPIESEELKVWNETFGLAESFEEELSDDRLSAVPLSTSSSDLKGFPVDFNGDMARFMFGASFPEETHVKLNPQGIGFLLRTTIRFNEYKPKRNRSIAANFSHSILALDGNDNLVVSEQSGFHLGHEPYRPGGKRIFVPTIFASGFVSFNTRIDSTVETEMGINPYNSDKHSVVLQVMLHERHKIGNMQIERDPRVLATFWQMQRFLQQVDMNGDNPNNLVLKSGL